MQLDQLRAVAMIAETGSFRQAAIRLRRSQPALTKAIKLLEGHVNVSIFQRTPRGVRLTEVGERLYLRAKSILSEIQMMEDEVAQLGGRGGGFVRVGTSPVGGTSILPQAIRQFRRTWPDVEIEIVNSLYPQSFNLLREASLDMVVGPIPQIEPHGSISIETYYEMDSIIVTHRNNPRKGATSIREIIDENWVLLGPAEGPSGLFAGMLLEQSISLPKVVTRCHSLSGTLALIATTNAFCILSNELFNYASSRHDLVAIKVTEKLPRFKLALATYKGRPLTPAAADLAKHIHRRMITLARETDAKPAGAN
ncbi:MAG: LysR family transcriptional regulator [Proteobacteria bacterium]|nr:LysR family transcriptional regulator [Pseudomonadota bacterium]